MPIYGLNYKDTRADAARLADALRQSRTTRRSSTRRAASASTSASTACPRPSSSTARRDPLQAHRPADARGARRQDRAAAEEAQWLSSRSDGRCAAFVAGRGRRLVAPPWSRAPPRRTVAAKDAAPEAADPGARGAHGAHHRRTALPGLPEPDDRRLERRRSPSTCAAKRASCCSRARATSEVVDYMTDRYGDFVLYRPPLKATTVLLWFGPALLLGSAARVLVIVCAGAPHGRRRVRTRRRRRGLPADRVRRRASGAPDRWPHDSRRRRRLLR